MSPGDQPVETWAVMVEDRRAKALVRNRKPPRPEYALLKSTRHRRGAMHVQEHIVMDSGKSLFVPKRADQEGGENYDKTANT